MRTKIATLSLVASFVATQAMGQVSLKNGNFFVGYTDLAFSGGLEPKIERTYSSKSSHNGYFGFGWGSELETFLAVGPDGAVVIHENGGGAHNRFVPPNITAVDVESAIAKIIAAKKKSGAGLSAELERSEKAKLKADPTYRDEEWFRLARSGLVTSNEVPVGVVFKSNRFGFQTVTRTKEGFVRRFDNGKVETYNPYGKLTRLSDKNQNFVNLSYDQKGSLVSLQDNLNRRMRFTFSKEGKIVKVEGEAGKSASYQYKGSDLVYSKDSEGNVFEYRYSGNGRHNLTEIKYGDNTKTEVTYHDVNKGETVATVKDRDGSQTVYSYGGDSISGDSYFTGVVVKNAEGKEVSRGKYEYYEKVKADGDRYTYKVATDVDGEKIETVYNECCGLPLVIAKNGEKTSFEYDKLGHVTKKISPREVTELSYNNEIGKVSKVVKYPKTGNQKPEWAQYAYDRSGNLVSAKNSDGKSVKLVYDFTGRIKALIDQNKRQLQFAYNEANRPVEIKDPAIGKINVQYTNSGEVKKVDSTGGRKIAMQVTSAFQNLLEIIKPAGVTLSF